MLYRSILRYPGGKSRCAGKILSAVMTANGGLRPNRLVEVFAGGASVSIMAASKGWKVWINDINQGVFFVWRLMTNGNTERLIRRISYMPASTDYFFDLRDRDEPNACEYDPLEEAARTLYLNRCSFSGLGILPIGGRNQTGEWKVGARWDMSILAPQIRSIADVIRGAFVTQLDFEKVITVARSGDALYLDPPYLEVGPTLYKQYMSKEDHVRLSRCLQQCDRPWVLSYDDHPLIRDLYGWAEIREMPMRYFLKPTSDRPSKNELLISRR